MKKLLISVLFLIFLSTLSMTACGSTETQTHSFSVGANPTARIGVGRGNVDIVVSQDDRITVVANLQKPQSVEYELSQVGDIITIEAKTRSGSRADLTVTMPANTILVLSIGEGDLNATGLHTGGA